ncbi:hypothetical protein CEXT_226031 [Caerostris extrusa]|uniref:Uncharacterized protein n=1 Tax=Caerostris extrusa TaxID=172846 RepID=A0AAV4XWX9_CAEEX|nr:hypothetical protein CEXT_226031 [Caerostris extrusa]
MYRLNTSETANVANVVNTSTLVKPAHNLKYKTKLYTSHGCTFRKCHAQDRERQISYQKPTMDRVRNSTYLKGAHINLGKARAINT